MSSAKTEDYEYSLTLPATPDRVWAAWTDPTALRAWFAEHAEVELRPGGAFRFWGKHTLGTPEAHEATQRLELVEDATTLAFTWTWLGVATRVEIALASDEWKPWPMGSDPPRREPQPGCKVTVRQTFAGALPVEKASALVDDHWRLVFGNLFGHLDDASVVLPDYAQPTAEVRLSLFIEAPPNAVFRTLTEPELLNRWLAMGARVDARVGGGIDLGWSGAEGADSGFPLRILELEPDRRLVISWPDWRGRTDEPDTRVSWDLVPENGGTRVDFLHDGFQRPVDRSDYQQGWQDFLGGLAQVARSL